MASRRVAVNPSLSTAGRSIDAITFLFTDIEGSTIRWEKHPKAMGAALRRHDAILRRSIEARGGEVFKTVGDAFFATFEDASDGLLAALDGQRELATADFAPEISPLRVRMALHTGPAEARERDYFGPTLNRAARLLGAGHGAQILLSSATRELVHESLPAGTELLDLGQRRFRGIHRSERIYQLVVCDLPSEFPPLRAIDRPQTNLPARRSMFIGRERELSDVQALLRQPDTRLVTLIGPGGTGKTRLATVAAAEMIDEYPDGVFFVPLATLRESRLIPSVVAQALQVREAPQSSLTDTLRSFCHDKHILLVLDNLEHLLDAGTFLAELLESGQGLKMLATSREPLRVDGEHVFVVSPLSVPEQQRAWTLEELAHCASVRLFVERAKAARSDFVITNDNASSVVDICRRLDGLPLAIELAAARTRILPPQVMLKRMGQKLSLLTGGPRDRPAHQQTLRDTIGWSYDLLSPVEKTLFRRLAAFQASFSSELGVQVAAMSDVTAEDAFDGIVALAEKSLLKQTALGDRALRFSMLETIREFALEKLEASGELKSVQRHLADALLSTLTAPSRGTERMWDRRYAELSQEHPNFRAALDFCVEEREIELGAKIALGLVPLWLPGGMFAEGRRWLEGFVAALGQDRAHHPCRWLRARMIQDAGIIATYQGNAQVALKHLEESYRVFCDIGDVREQAWSLTHLGFSIGVLGDIDRGLAMTDDSLKLHRAHGDAEAVFSGFLGMGELARASGRYDQALSLYEGASNVCRKLENPYFRGIVLSNLGQLAIFRGENERAIPLFKETIAYAQQLGNLPMVGICIMGLGAAFAARGELFRAAKWLGTSEALLEATSTTLEGADRETYQMALAMLNAGLSPSELRACLEQGRETLPEEVIEEARAVVSAYFRKSD